MEEKNINKEVLSDIYKNAHIALISISDISSETDDIEIKTELLAEYEAYEKIIGKISTIMAEYEVEPKEPGNIKKSLMWASIKFNTLTDNSNSHIADMMVQGTNMGIVELIQILNEKKNLLEPKIAELAQELLELEQQNYENLKKYL